MERARVERRAKDASFESLPVEVVREILVRRARDETWIFYARASFRSRPSSFFASRVSGAPMRRNAGRQVSRLDSSEV